MKKNFRLLLLCAVLLWLLAQMMSAREDAFRQFQAAKYGVVPGG